MKHYRRLISSLIVCLLVMSMVPLLSLDVVNAASITSYTPIAHYSFDDPDALGHDFSGNGNHLVKVTPDDVEGVLSTSSSVYGTLGTSMKLNGTAGLRSDLVDFTDELVDYDFSVVLFYKNERPNDVPAGTNSRVLSSGVYGNSEGFFFANNNTSNPDEGKFQQLFFGMGGYDWWSQGYRTNWRLDEAGSDWDDSWHMYVLVSHSTKMSHMYIDGSETVFSTASLRKPVLNCPTQPFTIGGSSQSEDGITYGLDEVAMGLIDEVRFYDFAFTPAQVDELAQAYSNGTIKATGKAPVETPVPTQQTSSAPASSAPKSSAVTSSPDSSELVSSSDTTSDIDSLDESSNEGNSEINVNSDESSDVESAVSSEPVETSTSESSETDTEPTEKNNTTLFIVLAVVAALIAAGAVVFSLKRKKAE